MPEAAAPKDLFQRWIHSHEEDTGGEMVFRPASFPFPPSRGRTGFEFRPDHSLVEVGIAPADGPQEAAGRWDLRGKELLLYKGGDSKPFQTLRIVSIAADRLAIQK